MNNNFNNEQNDRYAGALNVPSIACNPEDTFEVAQEEITKPQEYHQQPALNHLGQDPYLSNQGWQDFDRDYENRERIQEVEEGNNSGLPSLSNSQLSDNRRLS